MKKMNEKFWRHLSTVGLLIFFAILAVGSSSTKKGIKAYKKGDLSQEKIKKLEAIGMVWDIKANKKDIEDYLEKLKNC